MFEACSLLDIFVCLPQDKTPYVQNIVVVFGLGSAYACWVLTRAAVQLSLHGSRSELSDSFVFCIAQAVVSLVAVLLIGQCAAQTITDADIYNFALNLEYLEVRKC